MKHITSIFGASLLACCLNNAMQEDHATKRIPIIFNVTSLVKQNVSSWRGNCHARSSFVLKKLSIISLFAGIFEAFGFRGLQERPGRIKFFEFLSKIPIPEHFPTVIFEGDPLPPIMTGWALGKLTDIEVMRRAHAFIDLQQYSDRVKEFYHTLVYITFDPSVMEQTTYVDPHALKLVDECKSLDHPTYLIGDCDPDSYSRLRTKWAHLVEKFDKVLFSHQISDITPDTHFDDAFWLHHLGIADESTALPEYAIVDDWIGPGERGDAPPHYASDSRTLKHLLK